jgi:putative tryptophan/tyrosine transport system substrate-binding protein
MRRRDVIGLIAGSAAAWPLAAHAQRSAMPTIGYLSAASLDGYYGYSGPQVAAFRQALKESGFVEGQNVAIELRWAEGHYDRLPALTVELVNRPVDVILASSLPAALAAKRATATIPIVFVMGADPVKLGVVASLNRPGGNLTGIMQLFGALGAKRLELIRELVPSLSVLAVLSNPNNPNASDHLDDVQTAARSIGQQIEVFRASSESEIDNAFAGIARRKAGALLVADDPLFSVRRDHLVGLAARHAIPASYYARDFAVAGGLMSYGSSTTNNYHEAGLYVGRILKGTKPADLPVLQPTKFELVINVKTAKALGLTVPPTLIALADEVIE